MAVARNVVLHALRAACRALLAFARHAVRRWQAARPGDPREVERVVLVLRRIEFPRPGERYPSDHEPAEREVAAFDPGENEHRDGILARTTVPARISAALAEDAVLIAGRILNALEYVGVIGVEMFVTREGLVINEIAPRVHNSGHWTEAACLIDQFEQHVRAVCGWPLGDGARHSDAEMLNLIGDEAAVYADKGYDSAARHALLAERGVFDGIMRRAFVGRPLTPEETARNRALVPVRCAIERVFGTLKRSYGWARVRYRGLARNAGHLDLLCLALNLRRLDVLTR